MTNYNKYETTDDISKKEDREVEPFSKLSKEDITAEYEKIKIDFPSYTEPKIRLKKIRIKIEE